MSIHQNTRRISFCALELCCPRIQKRKLWYETILKCGAKASKEGQRKQPKFFERYKRSIAAFDSEATAPSALKLNGLDSEQREQFLAA